MAVNKKLGKGLSSLLGNKDLVQKSSSYNKGLLLSQSRKYSETRHNQEKNLIKKK